MLLKRKTILITSLVLIFLLVGGVYVFWAYQTGRFPFQRTTLQQDSQTPSQTENVPSIPKANVLFIVKDEEGNLIAKPTVKVEVLYDNPYYDYDYEVNFRRNPELIGLLPTESTRVRFYMIKFGYELTEVEGTSGEEFWGKYDQIKDTGIVDEVVGNSNIPPSGRSLAKELAEEATLLRIVTLKKTDVDYQSFDQLKYSNYTILLLYTSENDPESELIRTKWEYLINKYPQLKTFEISKEEADDILASDRLIKANESVIILHRHRYDDALYYGEKTGFEATSGGRVFFGDRGFSAYELKVQYLLEQEEVADLVEGEHDGRIQLVKDVPAGMVLLAASLVLIIGATILLPRVSH